MRGERLVEPEAKSFCSTSSVRLPARAHSRAMAMPTRPPPMTATWKCWPARGGRIGPEAFMLGCGVVDELSTRRQLEGYAWAIVA